MRAEFQPDIHSKLSNRIDRRRELDGLSNSAGPMPRVTTITVWAGASDGAEQRDGFRLRRKISKGILKRFGSRLHHRVVKRVIDSHEPGKHALRLKFGKHRFNRVTRTGEGKRAGAVE